MGGTSWSDAHYNDRTTSRLASGTKTFDYSSKVASGAAPKKAHVSLDPIGLKAGKREVRDSDAHPNSNAVYIGLDVTGSMQTVPGIVQGKLKELMALLLTKGYLPDPAICVSAIGDAAYDRVPFQVGQFESGIEIENDLTNLYLEGGGGGNNHESYDIALYFLARKVEMDCFEKRGKKGYAFIVCDESLQTRCKAEHVNTLFNDGLTADIPIEELLAEVNAKWELYVIVPKMTLHYKTSLQDSWVKAIGQRLLYVDDPDTVVETIASCIGVIEETVDMDSLVTDLRDVSKFDDSKVNSVTTALATVSPGGGALSKITSGSTGLATLD